MTAKQAYLLCALAFGLPGCNTPEDPGPPQKPAYAPRELQIDVAATGCKPSDYKRMTDSLLARFRDKTVQRYSVLGYQLRWMPRRVEKNPVPDDPRNDTAAYHYYWPDYGYEPDRNSVCLRPYTCGPNKALQPTVLASLRPTRPAPLNAGLRFART